MKHFEVVPGGRAGAGMGGEGAALLAAGVAAGGRAGPREEAGGDVARRLVAFGSLPALSGETLEACLERLAAASGRIVLP